MKDRESVTTNGKAVFYAAIWNDLRQAAMDKGWALALHGSLASDMDIMAMPWAKDATTDVEMIESLKGCFTDANCINVEVSDMPNNRRVYTFSIWADFYLDINVIKPVELLHWKDEAVRIGFNKATSDDFRCRKVCREPMQDMYYSGWMDCYNWLLTINEKSKN